MEQEQQPSIGNKQDTNSNEELREELRQVRMHRDPVKVTTITSSGDRVVGRQPSDIGGANITMSREEYDVLCTSLKAENLEYRRQVEQLALYLREHYYLEIRSGLVQHQRGTAVDAAIHYLNVERGRWRIKAKQLLAALFRYSKG